MLWTLFVVLLVLWFLGVVSSYTLGGFIHLLLVLALIAVVLQLVQPADASCEGRRHLIVSSQRRRPCISSSMNRRHVVVERLDLDVRRGHGHWRGCRADDGAGERTRIAGDYLRKQSRKIAGDVSAQADQARVGREVGPGAGTSAVRGTMDSAVSQAKAAVQRAREPHRSRRDVVSASRVRPAVNTPRPTPPRPMTSPSAS